MDAQPVEQYGMVVRSQSYRNRAQVRSGGSRRWTDVTDLNGYAIATVEPHIVPIASGAGPKSEALIWVRYVWTIRPSIDAALPQPGAGGSPRWRMFFRMSRVPSCRRRANGRPV